MIGLLLWVAISSTKTLHQTVRVLNKISEGDLTKTLKVNKNQRDEFSQLGLSVNTMLIRLKEVLGEVTSTSVDLSGMADQLSLTTHNMATSNSKIADQARSVATAADEMTATVTAVAQSTATASQAASKASNTAREGGQVIQNSITATKDIVVIVNQATDAVNKLSAQSVKIGGVIEVIDGLAGQTNLLALNAAIEAARAGEAGRGFAVVAEEVRKLAESTVHATSEIGEIVNQIQQDTKAAVVIMHNGNETAARSSDLGSDAAKAVQSIEGQSAIASSRIEQIAVAAEQLTTTIQDMSLHMDQIAQNIGENSSATDKIAETATEVNQQAERLQRKTTQFKIVG